MSQLFIGKPDYQNEPDYCAYFFELVPEIGLLDALKQRSRERNATGMLQTRLIFL